MQGLRQFATFSTVGLLLGTLLFAASLTPSLLPRPLYAQGVVSGLSFTAGYALGVAGHWVWAYLHLPEPGPRLGRIVTWVAALLCGLIAVAFLWQASAWQNSVRELMGMDEVRGIRPLTIALLSLLVFSALLLLARLFRRTFHFSPLGCSAISRAGSPTSSAWWRRRRCSGR